MLLVLCTRRGLLSRLHWYGLKKPQKSGCSAANVFFARILKPRVPPERWLAEAAYLSHHAVIVIVVVIIIIGIDVI